MKFQRSLVVLALSASVSFLGCQNDDGSTDNTDSPSVEPVLSADSGTPADAGPIDSGTGVDSGTVLDAGATPTDAGEIADAGSPTDAGNPTEGGPRSIACGDEICEGAEVCCGETDGTNTRTYCATSCTTDAGSSLTLSCDDQSDCGSSESCCADLQLGAGRFPCPFAGGSAACSASCTTLIPPSCNSQATVVLCQSSSECADQGAYSQCCMFSINGLSTQFCASFAVAYGLNSTGCVP